MTRGGARHSTLQQGFNHINRDAEALRQTHFTLNGNDVNRDAERLFCRLGGDSLNEVAMTY